MMTKEIELTQGKAATVDNKEYDALSKFKWHAVNYSGNYYAARKSPTINNKRHIIYMHRAILGLEHGDGLIADHINRITLDNRSNNLRVVSKSENNRNNNGHSHNTSGYTGVCWENKHAKWRAYIKVANKAIHLGYYDDIEDAVKARKQGELDHWHD